MVRITPVGVKYLNGQKPALRDAVVGRDKGGHPVGGHVLETNGKGEILISPAVHTASWAKADECLPVKALFEPGQVAEQPKSESEKEETPA